MSTQDITQKMKILYDSGLTLEEVGKRFGMTRQGVRDRFLKAGIPRRQPKKIEKDRLETLYFKDNLPISTIAAVCGVSKGKIERELKCHEIPRREPLKLGGYIVDFLRKLKIGAKDIIEWRSDKEYAHLHHTAKLVGIKISVRSCGGRKFEVTRLE